MALSAVLYLLIVPINLINGTISLIASFILYSLFTYFLLKKTMYKSTLKTVIAVILGRIILEIPVRILHFYETLASLGLPICSILGIIAAYVYFLYKNKAIAIIFFLIALWLFIVFYGDGIWYQYCASLK